MRYTQRSELILIYPRVGPLLINLLNWILGASPEPYVFLVLEALTSPHYRITTHHQKYLWFPWDFRGNALVGITCLTPTAPKAYRLADKFRRAGATVILGGPHVSALPEEASHHADAVVVGEAESVWKRIIRDFESGSLQKIYHGIELADFSTPVHDALLRMPPRRLMLSGVHIGRGCKYRCDFCYKMSSNLRLVRLENVIEVIKRISTVRRILPGIRPCINFVSDNIFSSPAYAKQLMAAMMPLGVVWGGNVSIDFAFDQEALDLAQKSGCRWVQIGFETMRPGDYSKTSLPQIKSDKDYFTAIRNMSARGIKIIGCFMIGLDNCTRSDYRRLVWFMMRAGLWVGKLVVVSPFPGSQLYERVNREGRLLTHEWRKYDMLTCVMKPLHMSCLELTFWFWSVRILTAPFSRVMWQYAVAYLAGAMIMRWVVAVMIY